MPAPLVRFAMLRLLHTPRLVLRPAIAGMVEPIVALVPALRSRGYADETLDALGSYAFHTLALPALAGVSDIPNAASDRMLRRVGFVPYPEVDGPTYPMRTYRLERPQATASSLSA